MQTDPQNFPIEDKVEAKAIGHALQRLLDIIASLTVKQLEKERVERRNNLLETPNPLRESEGI